MRFHVLREAAGETVETFLSRLVGIGPRTALKRALSAGQVVINGQPATRTLRVTEGDVIEIRNFETSGLYERANVAVAAAPDDMPLEIVTRSQRLVVIDKPSGQAAHPLGPVERDAALNAIVTVCPGAAAAFRPDRPLEGGLVHRLDRGTSGLLACALNESGWTSLRAAWTSRSIEKIYLAWLDGELELSARLDLNLAHDPKSAKRMTAFVAEGEKSWPAATSIRTLKKARQASGDFATLALIRIHTGVTHQIRATTAVLGHPVVGDEIYSAESGTRSRRASSQKIDQETSAVFDRVRSQLKSLACPLPDLLPKRGFFLHALYLRARDIEELWDGVYAEPPEHFG